ncbi:MAG: NAD(P)-dependent oxidoreductase [Actinomycetia bacterium]|nr:NAD(P)-dependent oxidoreductase [Actinomycetes bacterium]MCP5033259.1 NAD(P)-dependent oxidoreductase [Actinomycetes bacterium]
MIIVDNALQRRHDEGRPVRLAVTGAGFINRGMTNRVANHTKGMEISVIVNRTGENAIRCYAEAGIDDPVEVDTVAQLTAAIESGRPAFTSDYAVANGCDLIDCVIEGTGTIHYALPLVLDAIANGRHVVMLNAELDGVIGPVLHHKAVAAGVVYTGCDGDQPGVQMNLIRFVEGIGARPLVAGNIKGLLDHYRTPATQARFAAEWGQAPEMVTSFADGTKIAFEQAVVANATGFTVAKRGMIGPEFDGFIDDAVGFYDMDMLEEKGGIVDYVVGTRPSPGVYVFAVHDDPQQRLYLKYGKLGDGPLYSFYVPYHLCHFEVPNAAARAVLFDDATIAPTHGPQVDVITIAKSDLSVGTTLDGLGGFNTYGLCERHDLTRHDRLIPMALAEGCTLVRDVAKDEALTYDDVMVPEGRLVDHLRAEQDTLFPQEALSAAS